MGAFLGRLALKDLIMSFPEPGGRWERSPTFSSPWWPLNIWVTLCCTLAPVLLIPAWPSILHNSSIWLAGGTAAAIAAAAAAAAAAMVSNYCAWVIAAVGITPALGVALLVGRSSGVIVDSWGSIPGGRLPKVALEVDVSLVFGLQLWHVMCDGGTLQRQSSSSALQATVIDLSRAAMPATRWLDQMGR